MSVFASYSIESFHFSYNLNVTNDISFAFGKLGKLFNDIQNNLFVCVCTRLPVSFAAPFSLSLPLAVCAWQFHFQVHKPSRKSKTKFHVLYMLQVIQASLLKNYASKSSRFISIVLTLCSMFFNKRNTQ